MFPLHQRTAILKAFLTHQLHYTYITSTKLKYNFIFIQLGDLFPLTLSHLIHLFHVILCHLFNNPFFFLNLVLLKVPICKFVNECVHWGFDCITDFLPISDTVVPVRNHFFFSDLRICITVQRGNLYNLGKYLMLLRGG